MAPRGQWAISIGTFAGQKGIEVNNHPESTLGNVGQRKSSRFVSDRARNQLVISF
jgi:hypothetical protein